MIAAQKRPVTMLVLLSVLVFVYNLGAGIYYAVGLDPLVFDLLYRAAFACGVVWWLRAEATRSAVFPIYCPGVLVSAGWLIIIPYHLLKTRGERGLIPLLALFGSFFAARILAGAAYLVLSSDGYR
jgi:hypothetical protein